MSKNRSAVGRRALLAGVAGAVAAPAIVSAQGTYPSKSVRYINQSVSKWTGEYELTLDAVIDEMVQRCRTLKLRAPGVERKLRLDLTVLLTARTVHTLYSPTRRQWLAL